MPPVWAARFLSSPPFRRRPTVLLVILTRGQLSRRHWRRKQLRWRSRLDRRFAGGYKGREGFARCRNVFGFSICSSSRFLASFSTLPKNAKAEGEKYNGCDGDADGDADGRTGGKVVG